MRVRPLLAVVFASAENKAFVDVGCKRTDMDRDVVFPGNISDPVIATARDADMAEAVSGSSEKAD